VIEADGDAEVIGDEVNGGFDVGALDWQPEKPRVVSINSIVTICIIFISHLWNIIACVEYNYSWLLSMTWWIWSSCYLLEIGFVALNVCLQFSLLNSNVHIGQYPRFGKIV